MTGWVVVVAVLILIYLIWEQYRSYRTDARTLATRYSRELSDELLIINRVDNLTRYVIWRPIMLVVIMVVICLLLAGWYYQSTIEINKLLLVFFALFGVYYIFEIVSRYVHNRKLTSTVHRLIDDIL